MVFIRNKHGQVNVELEFECVCFMHISGLKTTEAVDSSAVSVKSFISYYMRFFILWVNYVGVC